MLSSLGLIDDREGCIISREDYCNGHTFFAFDLNHPHSHSTLMLENCGSVILELRFSSALQEAVTLLTYYEFEGILTIDKSRQVLFT